MANPRRIEPMLTTSDVARLLNVHINTVRRWSNQGTLKTYRIGARGDRRFRREDIANFLSPETSTAGGNGGGDSSEKPSLINGNKVLANY
jgi:excisionase family DNA binding protein